MQDSKRLGHTHLKVSGVISPFKFRTAVLYVLKGCFEECVHEVLPCSFVLSIFGFVVWAWLIKQYTINKIGRLHYFGVFQDILAFEFKFIMVFFLFSFF